MNSVKVDRLELLKTMAINRDAHRALFVRAQEGFRARAIEALDEMLAAARNGDQVRMAVGLEPPEDHTDDYARVIAMLEMSIDSAVDVTERDFERYVRDRWEWSAWALAKNTAYAGGDVVAENQVMAVRTGRP